MRHLLYIINLRSYLTGDTPVEKSSGVGGEHECMRVGQMRTSAILPSSLETLLWIVIGANPRRIAASP